MQINVQHGVHGQNNGNQLQAVPQMAQSVLFIVPRIRCSLPDCTWYLSILRNTELIRSKEFQSNGIVRNARCPLSVVTLHNSKDRGNTTFYISKTLGILGDVFGSEIGCVHQQTPKRSITSTKRKRSWPPPSQIHDLSNSSFSVPDPLWSREYNSEIADFLRFQ